MKQLSRNCQQSGRRKFAEESEESLNKKLKYEPDNPELKEKLALLKKRKGDKEITYLDELINNIKELDKKEDKLRKDHSKLYDERAKISRKEDPIRYNDLSSKMRKLWGEIENLMLISDVKYDRARASAESLGLQLSQTENGIIYKKVNNENFAEAKKPRRMLQTIVVSKTIAKDEDEAKDIARKHGVTGDLIETDSSWRFRQRNASEFDPDSFKTKKEEGVALVYADLLDSGEEFDEEEYLDFDFPEDEVVKETVEYKDKTQVTEKPPEKIRAKKASAYELEQAKKLGNKKKSEIALKGKKAEIEKKVSGKKKGSAKDIQLSYNQETKRFEAPKGLPQYVEARGETYEYDGRKWSAPSGNFMMPHALASSLINNESQPIGDDMIKVSSDKLQFAESKHKSKEKEILQKIVKEKDPLKVNELFHKLEEVEFGGVSFAEQRSESYESAQNFLKRQRELEKDIIDLRWDLKALYHEARNTPVEKGLDANYELIDKIADAEKALAKAKEELKSFNKGERKFAEDLVITQIEEPIAQKNLSRAKKAELKLKKKELNANNDEDKKYRNIVSIGEAESEKFDEQLNYDESLPDEVITNENGNIVMYKFNTEEDGYQIKAIISPEGETLPIEEDEEAIFSIDMLVDPQPVPGTKYIEGSDEQQDFGLLSLIEAISPANAYMKYVMKPHASLLGADPDSEWENKMYPNEYDTFAEERDDLPDEETWRLTLEDYDRDFNDLMSKPGKGTQVRNLKEKLRDYLIEKEIPIYEILQKYPNIREAFLLPVKEYPVMKSSKFSEVASHLKEVALDEIQDSEELTQQNKTLFKYYLNEFIDEKESEGLKPIQIDVALTKSLGSSLHDSRKDEINEVYSKRFPMGLKEFAEEVPLESSPKEELKKKEDEDKEEIKKIKEELPASFDFQGKTFVYQPSSGNWKSTSIMTGAKEELGKFLGIDVAGDKKMSKEEVRDYMDRKMIKPRSSTSINELEREQDKIKKLNLTKEEEKYLSDLSNGIRINNSTMIRDAFNNLSKTDLTFKQIEEVVPNARKEYGKLRESYKKTAKDKGIQDVEDASKKNK